jgi:hypothetical protein
MMPDCVAFIESEYLEGNPVMMDSLIPRKEPA